MSISKKLMTTGATGDTFVDDVFSTHLFEGNGTVKTIVNGIDLSDKGGLVWIKDTTVSENHALTDTVQAPYFYSPASDYIYPFMQSQSVAGLDTGGVGIVDFNDNGFDVLGRGGDNEVNTEFHDNVAWTFRQEPGFFDIVTYTGAGETGQTITHGLGTPPGMVIIKSTVTGKWFVYHRSLGSTSSLRLNTSDGALTDSNYLFGSTATNTHFSIGTGSEVDSLNVEYVAYFFGHNEDSEEGIIQCGSYTGNGSTDGPEIDLGWEPQWLLFKKTSDAFDNWTILDTMRGISPGTMPKLYPNTVAGPDQYPDQYVEVNSRGFKLKYNASQFNANNANYIYMAIRRPNKPAEEFEPEGLYRKGNWAVSGSGAPVLHQPTEGTDDMDVLMMRKIDGSTYQAPILSRLTRPKYLEPYSANGEAEDGQVYWGYDGFKADIGNAGTNSYWLFKRAAGFLDTVCYSTPSSTATSLTIPHNLGVKPSMIWVKKRNGGQSWYLWLDHLVTNYSDDDNPPYSSFAANSIRYNEVGIWGDGDGLDYTDTEFKVGYTAAQGDSEYIAYLFGDTPGVSASGSYTGNGFTSGEQTVDVGFPARLVFIRRVDNTGIWRMHYDLTASGSTEATLGNADTVNGSNFIKQTPNGFKVGPDGETSNETDGDYFYYAIA